MADPEAHFPYTRPLRRGWRQIDGRWVWTDEDPHRWEVLCAQCGDTDGPAQSLPEGARRLRGPYEKKHAAHRAVKHHENEHPAQTIQLGPTSNWPVF